MGNLVLTRPPPNQDRGCDPREVRKLKMVENELMTQETQKKKRIENELMPQICNWSDQKVSRGH